MAICEISQTSERSKFVDFTEWHTYDEIAFVSLSPQKNNVNTVIVKIMHYYVWIILFILFIVNVFLFDIFARLDQRNTHRMGKLEIFFTLYQVFLSRRELKPNFHF